MKNFIIASFVAFTFVSCHNNETTPEATTTAATEIKEGATEANTITIEPTATTNSETPATGKLNPPHGEPGHRCEIPVGAPLDSEPNKPVVGNSGNASANNSATSTITPTFSNSNTAASPTFSAPATEKTTTAPGMNPPHGEPGHDCAIPVGAPLKK